MSDLAGLVERLRHCSENTADEYLRELTGRAADALEAFRWIPVSERLPERYRTVLVCGGTAHLAGQAWYSHEDNGRRINWEVTHWMPLPEPPAPEQGD